MNFLKESFNNGFMYVKNNYEWMYNLKSFVIYCMKPNISRLIVHNFHFNFNLTRYRTINCNDNCKICDLIYKESFLSFDGILLPLLCNSNCNST